MSSRCGRNKERIYYNYKPADVIQLTCNLISNNLFVVCSVQFSSVRLRCVTLRSATILRSAEVVIHILNPRLTDKYMELKYADSLDVKFNVSNLLFVFGLVYKQNIHIVIVRECRV